VDVLALAAKSLVAVMLLVAGGAKLADVASFAMAVRLFVSFRVPRPVLRWIAIGVALAELALGAGSLSWPAAGWLNPVVFAMACGFVAVSIAGYVFHRGLSCRCFGALSRRKFDAMGVLRSMAIAAVAAASMSGVAPGLVDVDVAGRVLLLAAGVLVALAAFTAAGSLAVGRKLGVEMR
jgi:hypothetical protein